MKHRLSCEILFYICITSIRQYSISGRIFYQRLFLTKDNTPPMPLPVFRDAHLGGLFFFRHEQESLQ